MQLYHVGVAKHSGNTKLTSQNPENPRSPFVTAEQAISVLKKQPKDAGVSFVVILQTEENKAKREQRIEQKQTEAQPEKPATKKAGKGKSSGEVTDMQKILSVLGGITARLDVLEEVNAGSEEDED